MYASGVFSVGKKVVDFGNVWNITRPYIPKKVFPLIVFFYRTCMRIRCWYVGLWDQRHIKKTGFDRLPPASLRYRVHGSPGVAGFLRVGKRCSQDIEAGLMKIGRDPGSFQHVLDFGCGCGRTLIWFANRSHASRFYGTDIDAEAISWCRSNLDFARCRVNKPLPPLEDPPETFDLIFAITVFTQLNEEYQFRWLGELKRVAKPKGILLLTVHGEHCWQDLDCEVAARVERDGFLFKTSNTMQGIFPQWYQTAYHTRDYIFNRYAEYFTILDYIPRGLNNHQDIVTLQKA